MPRFRTFCDGWCTENATQIASGAAVIHELAKVGGVDADTSRAKRAVADVERLRKTTLELLARHCQLILESPAPPTTN